MDKNIDIVRSLSVINNVASWFGDRAHRWPVTGLSIGYAMACVEVVSKSSEVASSIYQEIIEAWGKPGIFASYKELMSEFPDSDRDELSRLVTNPEPMFPHGVDALLKEYEELVTDPDFAKAIFKDEEFQEKLSPEQESNIKDVVHLLLLIFLFIQVGFNRESEIKKGKFRVEPSDNAPWLIISIIYRTAIEYANITLDMLRQFYKVGKYKGKVYDFENVLLNEPMSRMHRRLVAFGKASKLKLRNDRIFMDAARLWYKCRVEYPGVNKYCGAFENYRLEPKNVYKQISLCDKAVGYQGRRRKTKN